MTVEQAITSISALPVEDQLRIVQAVWDRMSPEVGTSLTDEQRAELDRRWEAYRTNPASGLTEEQLRAELRDARL